MPDGPVIYDVCSIFENILELKPKYKDLKYFGMLHFFISSINEIDSTHA